MSIYLDHNATSPPQPDHWKALVDALKSCYGNPSSPHEQGRSASVAITKARHAVAKSLGVGVADLIFVSGGTEANHLGTVGVLSYQLQMAEQTTKPHVIISAIEHPAVYAHLEHLHKMETIRLTVAPVDEHGFVSFDHVISSITPETTLIAIMAANNEVGSLQPVKKIGDYLNQKRWHESTPEAAHFQKIHFHVDGVQIFGKIPTEKWMSDGMDSVALSAHKLGALQGVGALFLRKGRKFAPTMMGGAQEKNRRPGTENLPGIVSFGLACQESLLSTEWTDQVVQMDLRRQRLCDAILQMPQAMLNSPVENALPNTVNFSLCSPRLQGEDMLLMLDMNGIYASSGSACSSGANLPSRTLLAMGRSMDLAKNAIRLSLSVNTTDEEIETVISCLKKCLPSD